MTTRQDIVPAAVFEPHNVHELLEPILSTKWTAKTDSFSKEELSSHKEEFLDFLNKILAWSLIEVGADGLSGNLAIEFQKETQVQIYNNKAFIKILEKLSQFRDLQSYLDHLLGKEKKSLLFHEVELILPVISKEQNRLNRLNKNYLTKKGKPNLEILKNCIYELAEFYYKFSCIPPTFYRHKSTEGSYNAITPWHQFCMNVIKIITPHLKFTITKTQVVTACESAIKKFNKNHPEII